MISIVSEADISIEELTALYFYASWMPYNKKMQVMIEKAEEAFSNLNVLAIDTDQFKTLCIKYKVTSIPTIIIFKDGIEKNRMNGLVLTSAFMKAFRVI